MAATIGDDPRASSALQAVVVATKALMSSAAVNDMQSNMIIFTKKIKALHAVLEPLNPADARAMVAQVEAAVALSRRVAALPDPALNKAIVDVLSVAKRGLAAPQPTSTPGRLDGMLDNLAGDMKALGVHTGYEGACTACKKPIVGEVVTALGTSWHPEHFACQKCFVPLNGQSFFDKDGMPYCAKCNVSENALKCAYCNQAIEGGALMAMDRPWHPDHFICGHCGGSLASGFCERDGRPFCQDCYSKSSAPLCGRCTEPIVDSVVTALDQHWHQHCFVCTQCSKDFSRGNWFERDGDPFCEKCFHEAKGTLCEACKKPISGAAVNALGKKFHPDHFVCSYCQKRLAKGAFKENHGKGYCSACHLKLYG